jgi:hypothetical protein
VLVLATGRLQSKLHMLHLSLSAGYLQVRALRLGNESL